MEEDKEELNFHRVTLRIDKELWERFLSTLPISISANEKIETMIRDFVLEYEYIIGVSNENPKKRQESK